MWRALLTLPLFLAIAGCGTMPGDSTGARGASTPAPAPAVFSRAGFDAAQAEASASGRAFLVDATAAWCGPCRLMDKSTWTDARVIAWIEKNAVAVQVDVDAEQSRARALRIEAMPTLILFRGDREIGRTVGYRTPEQLLSWLNQTS